MKFLAPLCNVAGKISDIELGAPFRIERWERTKLIRTIRKLELLPTTEVTIRLEIHNCIVRGKRYAYVVVADAPAAPLKEAGATDFLAATRIHQQIYDSLNSRLGLLRLFKSGHVEAYAMYFYEEMADGKIDMDGALGPHTAPHEEKYYVTAREAKLLNAFISVWNRPSRSPFSP